MCQVFFGLIYIFPQQVLSSLKSFSSRGSIERHLWEAKDGKSRQRLSNFFIVEVADLFRLGFLI